MAHVRVLVVYGSSRGGTAGLAVMLAEALGHHDVEAVVEPAKQVDDLSGYDAVIVGGALYSNRWHPDAVGFVHRFQRALLGREVWFFSSGPLDASAATGALAPVPQVRELARATDIRGHMTFGGVLAQRPAGRLAALLSYGPVGDWRDRRQVEQWVERIVTQLAEVRRASTQPGPAARPAPKGTAGSRNADRPVVVLPDAAAGAVYPDSEAEPEHGGLARIRRMLTLDEIEDDAGLDVLL